MASKRTSKKSLSKISSRTAERIAAISLQHPELGARRLVPLLKKQRIAVSFTTVQSILRRKGLQNREKRLAKMKKQAQIKKRTQKAPKPRSPAKKPAASISDEVAGRIVAISLQNPDFGAGRLLPLLKKERIRIPASTVYAVLKRHGLQSRSARLAKLKEQTRATRRMKAPPKRPKTRITDDAAERICEISLQNPDFGAGRLVPLLAQEGILASSSAVYRILKRRGLQTREKRMAKAAKAVAEPVSIPKTFRKKIPPEVEDRIVEISLQNPEFGAGRLAPLLQQEEILVSVSAVYKILKRHGLENRQKRLLRLEERVTPEIMPKLGAKVPETLVEAAESEPPVPEAEVPELIDEAAEIEPILIVDEAQEPVFEPAVAAPILPEIEPPEPAEEPEVPPVPTTAEPAQPERPPIRKALIPPLKKKGHWVFYPLYLLLFVLIGYLAFHSFRSIQTAMMETKAPQIDDFSKADVASKAVASAQPLDGYRQIWERNLFNTGKAKESDSAKKISLEKIAPAKKDLGLELVGTVVSDDPSLSRAIIDNRSIKKQEAYREGDKAGKVKIKKILRNNVVITTAEGDELLTVEIKESSSIIPARLSQRVGSQSSSGSRQATVRALSLNLKRDEVAAAFNDMDGFIKELRIVPYNPGDQPSGFMISRITAQNVLRKMGLRSRDVITGINGETVTGPEQAAAFFETLSRGGEVTINFQRRRRNRQIKLNIE